MGSRSYDDIFGDLDKPVDREPFAVLPDKTYVLATIKEVGPKEFTDGRASVQVVSKTDRIQASVADTGNYGSPMFWDSLSFVRPVVPAEDASEEEVADARKKAGFWARKCKAVGVDYHNIDPDATALQLAKLFADTVGTQVIIKTRYREATGTYKPKAEAYDYLPATPENLAKYGLANVDDSDINF